VFRNRRNNEFADEAREICWHHKHLYPREVARQKLLVQESEEVYEGFHGLSDRTYCAAVRKLRASIEAARIDRYWRASGFFELLDRQVVYSPLIARSLGNRASEGKHLREFLSPGTRNMHNDRMEGLRSEARIQKQRRSSPLTLERDNRRAP
jgi:hypothetical protein